MPAPRAIVVFLLLSACAGARGASRGQTVQVPVQPVAPRQPTITSVPLASGGPRAPGRTVGDHVEVEWHGSWWPAVVRELRGERFLVHYDGYGEEWDEVVYADRVRDRGTVDADEPDDPEVEPDP